jgi:hypothetical protein
MFPFIDFFFLPSPACRPHFIPTVPSFFAVDGGNKKYKVASGEASARASSTSRDNFRAVRHQINKSRRDSRFSRRLRFLSPTEPTGGASVIRGERGKGTFIAECTERPASRLSNLRGI